MAMATRAMIEMKRKMLETRLITLPPLMGKILPTMKELVLMFGKLLDTASCNSPPLTIPAFQLHSEVS
jgi:hypothetical protein